MASSSHHRLSSFEDLPMEIILHIFKFLGYSDLQAAGATCSQWREALHSSDLNSNTLVRFQKTHLDDSLPPASLFLQCERPFRFFKFEDCTFGNVQKLMEHIGRYAVEIIFDNIDIGAKQFCVMISQLPHLHRLTIVRCSQLFMCGSFLEKNDDRLGIASIFSKIKHLSLSHNQYLSDAILLRLTALIQTIETLDCSGCHIAYHNAINRRFYPHVDTNLPSESILTFKFLRRILELHRPHIRELNLGQTMLGGQSLAALCDLEMNLLSLRLNNCRQLNSTSVKSFLKTQSQLTVLDISDTVCANDGCIEVIVIASPLIEDLNVAGCAGITNAGTVLMGDLKKLRRLNISRCEGISTEGLRDGIARTSNTTLRELVMTHLRVCEDGIKCLAQNLTELRILNLENCVNGVTDKSVQCIVKNLRWLRVLSLEDCFQITDGALTGINLSSVQHESPSKFKDFNTELRLGPKNSKQPFKISLRSKAEEDIVRDANRKRAMFAAYELNFIDPKNFEGDCIMNLCGLKDLNLQGCNKITDVSLKYGIKFLELKKLSLARCQQVSYIGMEAIAQNCPSLEELDVSDCYNINDETIKAVTSKLRRLRMLNITGCAQLSEHSLDAILVNCKYLQTLSMYRCYGMSTSIEERLSHLSSLRNLNVDNSVNVDGGYLRT